MKDRYYFLILAMFILSFSCTANKEKKDAADLSVIESGVLGSEDLEFVSGDDTNTEEDERGYIINIGDIVPDFTLKTTTGETFKLSDKRGKIIMLQFTASWCSVCRKEMPFIESDIWKKHKDNPDFCLLGIDRDEPLDKVLEFVKQTGITYPMALDPGGDVFSLYAEREAGITRNVIIDPSFKVAMLTRLYDEEEFASMCKKIDELLEHKSK